MASKYTKEIADFLNNKKESETIKRMKLVDKLADGIKISNIVMIRIIFSKIKFSLSNNFKNILNKINDLFKSKRKVKEKAISDFYHMVNYGTGKSRPIKLSIQDRINKIILKYKIILNIKFGWFTKRDNKVNYMPINNPNQQEFLNKLLSNKNRIRILSNLESK